MDEVSYRDEIPRCACGGMLRPGVVWFGEALPEVKLDAAVKAARNCDLFLTVGTSAVVYPAAGLVPLAKSSGARKSCSSTRPDARKFCVLVVGIPLNESADVHFFSELSF